jgi:hypothetical protein
MLLPFAFVKVNNVTLTQAYFELLLVAATFWLQSQLNETG